jgi:hypothetical protein
MSESDPIDVETSGSGRGGNISSKIEKIAGGTLAALGVGAVGYFIKQNWDRNRVNVGVILGLGAATGVLALVTDKTPETLRKKTMWATGGATVASVICVWSGVHSGQNSEKTKNTVQPPVTAASPSTLKPALGTNGTTTVTALGKKCEITTSLPVGGPASADAQAMQVFLLSEHLLPETAAIDGIVGPAETGPAIAGYVKSLGLPNGVWSAEACAKSPFGDGDLATPVIPGEIKTAIAASRS